MVDVHSQFRRRTGSDRDVLELRLLLNEQVRRPIARIV